MPVQDAKSEKDKKKKDKKKKDNKKTDTPPLHKEDTASADSGTLSLSFAEKEEQDLSLALDRMEKAIQEHPNGEPEKDEDWAWGKTVLLVEHSRATTLDERVDMRRKFREEVRKVNPLVSREELKSLLDKAMLRTALELRRNEPQRKKHSLLLSALAEKKKEDELLVRGPAQDALLAEFARSLTMAESSDLYAEVKAANPNAPAKELGGALRAFKLQAALVTCMAQEESARWKGFLSPPSSTTSRNGQAN
jgi:hypothetical protein